MMGRDSFVLRRLFKVNSVVDRPRILYIEPFEAGSHAAFTRRLQTGVDAEWTSLTLPGRHWKWRARGAAIYFVREHWDTLQSQYDLLWAGSFLNLADLLALSPNLQALPRILYFHENQLAYPNQAQFAHSGDHHYGFSQMVSCLAATHCVFNSEWNLESFLQQAQQLLRRMPDRKPSGWVEEIRERSSVLPVPLELPEGVGGTPDDEPGSRKGGPIILWNQRWEHDKAPEVFFGALSRLKAAGVPFRLAVCGERYRAAPDCFERAEVEFADQIVHWGFLESRAQYEALLRRVHLVVSTAQHEFFGISLLEAAHCGARPVVPDRLSYPELFDEAYRYRSDGALFEVLKGHCLSWVGGATLRGDFSAMTARFGAPTLKAYRSFIEQVVELGI